MACGTSLQDIQIKNRDTSDVPLYTAGIEAHVCICFVALKVYKELERLLKFAGINMSVDKVVALAQTIVTIQLTLPQNKQTITRTMLMKRHQRIAPLFDEAFWVTH